MDKNFQLGYNEGLTTAVRFLSSLADDLAEFGDRDALDAAFLREVVDGLRDLFLDIEE